MMDSTNENAIIMPIDGKELTQLQFLYSLYRVLKDDNSLQPRFSRIGLWWRYRGILSQLHNLFDAAWKTIPQEKRERINRIWSQQELRVVNSASAVDPTGDMVMVPKAAILYMGQHCQKESCAVCMGNHSERRDCLFRRGMVALSLPDLRKVEKQSGKCMGKLFERRDCLFRRGMVALSLPDLRKVEKQSGKCMGKLFDWRDQ